MGRNPPLLSPLSDTHIEPRIINEDNRIGLKLYDISFAKINISKNCSKIGNHFPKSHKSQIAVMLNEFSPNSLHPIPSPEAKLCLGVYLL